jgi:hypothetical protein
MHGGSTGTAPSVITESENTATQKTPAPLTGIAAEHYDVYAAGEEFLRAPKDESLRATFMQVVEEKIEEYDLSENKENYARRILLNIIFDHSALFYDRQHDHAAFAKKGYENCDEIIWQALTR